MVRVALAGAAGRMGRRIAQVLDQTEGALLAAGFEAPGHPLVGQPLSVATGVAGLEGTLGDDAAAALEQAQVLIDFTAPEATLANLEAAARAGKAAVVGTTGLSSKQQALVAEVAGQVPVVFSPNMSVGMNLMFQLVRQMAEVLGEDYALELVEAHHDQKKDAPSGTAVKLLDQLAAARGWKRQEVCVYGRQGMVGPRPKREIGVGVIRGGDVVGEHTVYFLAQGERLELTHRAHSRDTFARGAVRAAQWVAQQPPGLYDMLDVLGLEKGK